MKPKIKKESPESSGLKYIKSASGWGLSAQYEEHKLVFSGVFNNTALKKPSAKNTVDIFSLFSASAKSAWGKAYFSAKNRNSQVCLEDIFLALLKEQSVKNLLQRINTSTQAAETLINNYLSLSPASSSSKINTIPFEAFLLSVKLHNHKVGSLMLLGAVLTCTPEDSILQAIFSNVGLTLEKIELFAVWQLNLNYDFPINSSVRKYLYCCRQTEMLERHFGYFFDLPAIELAVILSANRTFKDLEHKKALQLLIKAANLAKNKDSKIIGENLITEAAK